MSSEVRHLLNSITRRITDLQTFQLPRLKECIGPLDLHRELSDEMRGDLEKVRYNLEVANEMSESLSRSEKEVSSTLLTQMQREYDDLKRAYREAMLSSKRAITNRRSRTHELLQTRNKPEQVDLEIENKAKAKVKTKARSAAEFGMGGDDELQTKTSEVTTALRRTTALMQTELERSVLSVQMLESSTQTLRSTNTLYTTYTSLLDTSSIILKQLEKADFIDRILIIAALIFFLLVVGFVIKRRVIDKTVGVVIGGVGKGVGWYLFGTGRLLKLAVMGKSKSDSGSLDDSLSGIEKQGIMAPLPQPGEDSAVGQQVKMGDEDEVLSIVPDPQPAGSPYIERGLEHISNGQGGKVEILPNPDYIRDRVEL